MTKRKYKRSKTFRLTGMHWDLIERNRERIEPNDEWSIRNFLQAPVWNGLALERGELNQARRDLGRDFFRAYSEGRLAGLEPVPGTRAPILWRKSE